MYGSPPRIIRHPRGLYRVDLPHTNGDATRHTKTSIERVDTEYFSPPSHFSSLGDEIAFPSRHGEGVIYRFQGLHGQSHTNSDAPENAGGIVNCVHTRFPDHPLPHPPHRK